MDRATWSRPTTSDEAARRNAGRRRYNAERRQLRDQRIRILLATFPLLDLAPVRGQVAEAAAMLGVSRRTLSRYLAQLRKGWYRDVWGAPSSEAEAARQAALHWRLFKKPE